MEFKLLSMINVKDDSVIPMSEEKKKKEDSVICRSETGHECHKQWVDF